MSALEVETVEEKNLVWILQKVDLSYGEAAQALERLEKAGLIQRLRSTWQLTKRNWTTTHDIPSSALRQAHREYMERALYSLEAHSLEERDITGMTMAISKSKLPAAKKMIAEFRRELSEFLENGPKEDVYRLNIQLFPLKKRGSLVHGNSFGRFDLCSIWGGTCWQ